MRERNKERGRDIYSERPVAPQLERVHPVPLPSCTIDMPTYNTTADWVVSLLRREDWVSRHQLLERLRINRHNVYVGVVKRLSPDEAVQGEATGMPVVANRIVVCKDTQRKTYKQTTLHKFFKKAPKKSPYIQTTIDTYFRRTS